MDLNSFPEEMQEYIQELLRRNAITYDSLTDKTFLNYLYSQKYDEDFVRSMMTDKKL